MNFQQRLGNSAYLDSQQFLFDKNGALILNKPDEFETTSSKSADKSKLETSAAILLNIKHFANEINKAIIKTKFSDDKLYELRDTSELISEALTKVIEPLSEPSTSSSQTSLQDNANSVKKVVNPISLEEFKEIANRVFSLFRNSVVSIYFLYNFLVFIDVYLNMNSFK